MFFGCALRFEARKIFAISWYHPMTAYSSCIWHSFSPFLSCLSFCCISQASNNLFVPNSREYCSFLQTFLPLNSFPFFSSLLRYCPLVNTSRSRRIYRVFLERAFNVQNDWKRQNEVQSKKDTRAKEEKLSMLGHTFQTQVLLLLSQPCDEVNIN